MQNQGEITVLVVNQKQIMRVSEELVKVSHTFTGLCAN